MQHTSHVARLWAGLLVLALLLTGMAWPAPSAQAANGVVISEIRIDQPSSDNDEYFELAGEAGTPLDGLTYLVIGDGAGGSGVIEAVVDLTGQVVPASGYFVAAEGTFSLGAADLTVNLNFENSDNVTHLLVSDFSGADGDDLDGDDDGVLDVTPWTTLVDLIALIKEENPPGSTEYHYGPPSVGPDGAFVPGHAFLCPEGWHIGPFDPAGGDDTPGAANACAPPPPPATPIYDIQFTADPGGASPYAGQTVTTQGVVTAFFDSGGDRYAFIQDGSGSWNGLTLFEPDGFVSLGDLVQVEGEVSEYYGLTQIAFGQVTVLSGGNPLPAPQLLATGDVSQESWESVLVRVEEVTVADADLGYGEWLVDDGTGGVRVDDLGNYSYVPSDGDGLDFVQGPLFYSFGDFKIEPRDDGDIGLAPASLSICLIQGDGFGSPYAGQMVTTQGLVFADTDQTGKRGFFIQDPDCDGDPATSDGLFVYKGNRTDVVSVGDLVEVRGTVQEYYDLTELSTNLSGITILSSGHPLPPPVELAPPFDDAAAWQYFEALEGMRVALDDAAVVGPTDYYDETWLVRRDLGMGRVFQDDPAGTGERVGVDDDGLFEISPEAKVGDRVLGLLGALDYTFGAYKMQLTDQPTLLPAPDPPKVGDADGDGDVDLNDGGFIARHLGLAVPPAPAGTDLDGDGRITKQDVAAFGRLLGELALKPNEYTVATFNLLNLFDTVDEPDKDDPVLSPADYERKLDKLAEAIHDDLREPTLIGVQEVENEAVLWDLIARPEIEASYGIVLVEGADERGIDVGLLYQTQRVTVLDSQQRQGCTTLVDGLGPDGNLDVLQPANAVTCDSDGDGVLDGNRLFSRPPLVVHVEVSGTPDLGRPRELWVIVNHWKSKSQDSATVEYTLPRRVEQASFVAGLAQEILDSDARADIVVLGDLNDFLDSQPLATLAAAGLSDLLLEAPKPERYTYIYEGVSEVLDHVLISQDLQPEFVGLAPVHINADYPVAYEEAPDTNRRSSDHDPVLTRFRLGR